MSTPYQCGGRFVAPFEETGAVFDANQALGQYTTVNVHSAYLGVVPITCLNLQRGYIALLSTVKTATSTIYVKEIDAAQYGLQVEQVNYPMSYLNRLAPTVMNLDQCKRNYDIIQELQPRRASLTLEEKRTLHKALIHNNPIDIHFQTCLFLDFLHARVGIDNVTSSNTLTSLHNVKGLDNAFFTGSYMVYGNGDSMFYPMGTIDICGHELGHGVVQKLAGLIYNGHAGALNESFADILGTMLEFYAYEKYPNLIGKADWFLGEDNAKSIGIMRNMQDPTATKYPQPKKYRGQYWADPNSAADYGGVHQNSGVGNYCFYNYCAATNKREGLEVFLRCLRSLKPTSSYIDYRSALTVANGDATAMNSALNEVGLTESATNDWNQPARTIVEAKKEQSPSPKRKHRRTYKPRK